MKQFLPEKASEAGGWEQNRHRSHKISFMNGGKSNVTMSNGTGGPVISGAGSMEAAGMNPHQSNATGIIPVRPVRRITFPELSFAVLKLLSNSQLFFFEVHCGELIDEDGNPDDGHQEGCAADEQQGSSTEADSEQ